MEATDYLRPGNQPPPRSPEATDYLRPGSMLTTARPQAQPGSTTSAVQAMRRGDPMAMDMLRQSAGLPGAQIGSSSSQGNQGPAPTPMSSMGWPGGGGQNGLSVMATPEQLAQGRQRAQQFYASGGFGPNFNPLGTLQSMQGGGFAAPNGAPPGFQGGMNPYAAMWQQSQGNPWLAAMAGGGMGGMGGPSPQMNPNQMNAAQNGMGSRAFYNPFNSPFGGMRQQGPNYGPMPQQGGFPQQMGGAMSPASLWRQQQQMAQFYGLQPGF